MFFTSLLFILGVFGDDKVSNLPGYGVPKETQYAGYVPVSNSSGGNLFYWFLASRSATAPDTPLVVWLNGWILGFVRASCLLW